MAEHLYSVPKKKAKKRSIRLRLIVSIRRRKSMNSVFSEVEEKSGRNEEAFTDSVKAEAEKIFLETLGALKAIYPELIPELP